MNLVMQYAKNMSKKFKIGLFAAILLGISVLSNSCKDNDRTGFDAGFVANFELQTALNPFQTYYQKVGDFIPVTAPFIEAEPGLVRITSQDGTPLSFLDDVSLLIKTSTFPLTEFAYRAVVPANNGVVLDLIPASQPSEFPYFADYLKRTDAEIWLRYRLRGTTAASVLIRAEAYFTCYEN